MENAPSVIKTKLPGIGTTIFTVMSELAKKHKAINLSQGFPDFDTHSLLTELVGKYMQEGHNQYAHTFGAPALREAVAKKASKAYGLPIDANKEVNITAGATQAIYTAITATIREGDEVLIFTPAYDCYAPAITLNGGNPIYLPLEYPDYSINWDDVRKLVSQRTRMIIINTPHNPTGKTLSEEDMLQLERLVQGSDILILSDEVYEHVIFDGKEHQSVLKYPGLAERSFAIFSFGKTFHNTGWKVGYCIAPAQMMEEFRKVHQYLVFSVNHPVQLALADFMQQQPEAYEGLSSFYQQKRDLFVEGLDSSRFNIIPAEGTYFQLLGYEAISQEDDVKLAKRITKEFGVASIPISVFYHREVNNNVLRFCFAKTDETLQQATEILCRI